jgi:hypothetical protein
MADELTVNPADGESRPQPSFAMRVVERAIAQGWVERGIRCARRWLARCAVHVKRICAPCRAAWLTS